MEKFFFEIPIYRCPIDKHTDELDKEKEKQLQDLVDTHGPDIKDSRTYEWATDYFDREKWYPWRYNEVIGWIRLYISGPQIRAELWFISAKKIMRTLKNKKFYFKGKAFEMLVHKSYSSDEIFNKIIEELKYLKTTWPIKGRVLDTELFESLGPFVDWRRLLGFIS